MQTNMEIVKARHPDSLRMDDFDGRFKRAQEHAVAGNGLFRRFGFFQTAKSPFLPPFESQFHYTADELKLVQQLVLIENYAGYFQNQRSDLCLLCGSKCRTGYREYIFRPFPGGNTYRWPEGLRHYFEYHAAKVPDWLPHLVEEFKKAQAQGLWR